MGQVQPIVSVIIPVYNGEKYISKTLDSVLGQTYNHIEIVIVNDGSLDNSEQVIQQYMSLGNVKYFYQENRGVAAARNYGIQQAAGELIAFVDQDDIWLPDKLEKQIRLMLIDTDLALVHGRIDFINEDGLRIEPLWSHPEVSGNCFKQMFSGNKIAMLTVLVKKESLVAAGMFDERIAITDDYDIWLKISYANRIGFIDEPIACYRYHGENTSGKVDIFKRNELLVLQNFLQRHQIGRASCRERV